MTEPEKRTIRLVSMSGGKDSTATLLVARERHPVEDIIAVFADTGNEHELVYEYLSYLEQALDIQILRVRANFDRQIAGKAEFVATKWREQGVPEAKVLRALAALKPTGNPYLDLCIWKGRFPSRMAQFCTTELKTLPLTDVADELLGLGVLVESWQGVRADESTNRAKLHDREDVGGGLSIYRPILKWNVEQVFAKHREHKIEPNPLYKLGMGRVGCMPCINARKGEIAKIAQQFPEHINRIAEWEKHVLRASKRDGATFFAAANKGEDVPVAEAIQLANVHAVVWWSRTERGGKSWAPEAFDEAPSCSSAYGLCE